MIIRTQPRGDEYPIDLPAPVPFQPMTIQLALRK